MRTTDYSTLSGAEKGTMCMASGCFKAAQKSVRVKVQGVKIAAILCHEHAEAVKGG